MGLEDYFTQTLKKDETVIAIIRKHWITIFWPSLGSLVVLGLLIGFYDLFFGALWSFIVWLILLAGVIIFAIYHWVIHFFDSFIITNMRIIDIDQTGLFKRTVSETMLENVEDVTYTIAGILATSLDYGAVSVQTAAAQNKIEINNVQHPRKVQEMIIEAQRDYSEKFGGQLSAGELIDLIARVKSQDVKTALRQQGSKNDQSDGVAARDNDTKEQESE